MIPSTGPTRLPTDLPKAIWVPSGSLMVYRGSPVEIVRQMVAVGPHPPPQLRESLQRLTRELATARRVFIQLPWDQDEEVLSSLFLHALLQIGIGKPVPKA